MQAIEVDCGPVTQELRLAVYARDLGYCRYCYRFMEPDHRYHIDHVRPRSFGGPTVLSNLVLACPPCNSEKCDRIWVPLPIFGDLTADLPEDALIAAKRRRRARLPASYTGSDPCSHTERTAGMLESWIRTEPAYGPGHMLPPADILARELNLGAQTVRDAYRLLAHKGLVTIRRGYGAEVRTEQPREVVAVPPGSVVRARMPTSVEARRWKLQLGVPVLVVGSEVWPADRYEIRTADHTDQ